MKKRLIAALVLVTLVIGMCGIIAEATTTPKYLVGYAKVDIDPRYTAEFRAFAQELYPAIDFKVDLQYKINLGAQGEITKTLYDGAPIPVALQGNAHTDVRLNIGNQDDNGDGIIDDNDGVFATAIAITSPENNYDIKNTVILMSTDLINGNAALTAEVRKNLFDLYGITGDRVMIDGSHSHHAPGLGATVNESKYNVAYCLQVAWARYVRTQLTEAAKLAIEDRAEATMSKGTIEAEEALCAQGEVGDYLNEIRAANNAAGGEQVEYVTELTSTVPAKYKTDKNLIPGYNHYSWEENGIKHVAVPELYKKVLYNSVRHDLSATVEATRVSAWQSGDPFYAYTYPKVYESAYKDKADKLPAEYKKYIPSNWNMDTEAWMTNEEFANSGYATSGIYATGNNFNSNFAVEGVGAESSDIKYIRWDNRYDKNDPYVLTRKYIDSHLVDESKFEIHERANGRPYIINEQDEEENVYKFVDIWVASKDEAVTEVDDTLLVLKFGFEEYNSKAENANNQKKDILLVNWRSHTNKNRKSSVDWKKEYTIRGFYDSFYQVSSDWINALRYGLEFANYRVAYFSGASGNVNGSYTFAGWYIPMYDVGQDKNGNTTYTEKKGTVLKSTHKNTELKLPDGTTHKVEAADVGKCLEAMYGYNVIDDGYLVADASHLKNAGAIYGTELAEVALELLDGKNPKYKMTTIDNPTGGIRSKQILYKTAVRKVSLEEFLAGGMHQAKDYADDTYDNNLSRSIRFDVYYWELEKNNPESAIIDEEYACSMLDKEGKPAAKVNDKGQPTGETYTVKEIQALFPNVEFDEDGKVLNCFPKEDSFTIASYLHANSAISDYPKRNSATGTQVELNAIMLCDQIAIITAPGELYDRYSRDTYWSDEEGIAYDDLDKNGKVEKNLWESLWNNTYGEPFFLGYCNNSTGYMPSSVTYEYNMNSTDKAKGSYETQTSNFAKGTGETVMAEFSWLLDQVNGKEEELPTVSRYCQHCKENVEWISLEDYLQHTVGLNAGHYYVAEDFTTDQLTVSTNSVCLDLNGCTLTGKERALYVSGSGVLNVQDSGSGGKVMGQGFRACSAGTPRHYDEKKGKWVKGSLHGGAGGTISVEGTLNLYSGTLTQSTAVTYNADYRVLEDNQRFKPGNGGVLYVSGVFNMYGGTITGGQSGWAGGNIYASVGSHLNLEKGSITGGTAYIGGTGCVMTKGTACLKNDASMELLLLWPEDQATPAAYANMLTVSGEYTGETMLSIRESALAVAGLDIGTSENARYVLGNLTVSEDSKLAPVVEGTDLVLRKASDYKGQWYCEHCRQFVHWKALSVSLTKSNALPTGHYCVDQDNDAMPQQSIAAGTVVCLDLDNKKLKGSERAFSVEGTLNIQDSSTEKNGELAGQGFVKTGSPGGTVSVATGGELNLYSGQLALRRKTDNVKPGNGGVVYLNGTFHMYGGTITDGESGNAGGNLYVGPEGSFNMYGGEITRGSADTLSNQSMCVLSRGYVLLAGDATIDNLLLWSREGPAIEDMLTVQGVYAGTTKLHFHSTVGNITVGKDIGNCDAAEFTRKRLTVAGSNLQVAVDGTELKLAEPRVAKVVTMGVGEQSYASFEAAMQDYQSLPYEEEGLFVIPQKLVLLNDVDELSINKTVVLDLNGCNVTTLTVEGDAMVYCMDSANTVVTMNADDKPVTNYYAKRCGVVKQADENVVVAAPAGVYKVSDQKVPANNVYLAITDEEKGGVTFHAVALNVTNQFLRPSKGGMYFSAEFGGDDEVKPLVKSYGIAMSITGVPTADTMGTTSLYTEMTGNFGDVRLNSVQNILTNIMKETNSTIKNRRQAATKVYVRAYVEIGEDEYLFGRRGVTSLQNLTEQICNQYISEEGILSEKLDGTKWDALKGMYNQYPTVMDYWAIGNLKTAIEREEAQNQTQ